MDHGTLYEDDIFAWSEQQASALRSLAGRRGLPNELDIANVAEEIEDLGKSWRVSAESFIRLILVHLIKLTAAPSSQAVKHWRREIIVFHIDLRSKLTPAMHGRIDLDALWRLAKREARARLDESGDLDASARIWTTPACCPLPLSAFVDDEFDIDAAVNALNSAES